MARDRASIRVDMWADGDFRRLSPFAQWLYMLLLSHPTLSYAGVADWRPGRIAALSEGCASEAVEGAAAELEHGRFILTDTETEEVLVRSFIKHDGLMKQPKLTVSMCKAFAAVASERLRMVIAHEVQKLHEREPDLKAWGVVQVHTILDAESSPIEAFTPGFTLPFTLPFTPGVTPGFTPNAGQDLGLRTSTATSTATPLLEIGGAAQPPSPFCSRHQQGTDRPCRGCKVAWAEYEKWASDGEPVEHVHRWLTDGSCVGCEEMRDAA